MSSSSSSTSLSTADIVGIVIGGILGLTTVIGLIFSVYAMCCKKQNQGQIWPQQYPNYPPNGSYGQPTNTGYYGPSTNNKPSMGGYDQPPAYSSTFAGSNNNNYAKY